MLNGFGGKITTYRKLAEEALERIGEQIGKRGAPWTGSRPLPGGDLKTDGVGALEAELRGLAPELSPETASRMVAAYGSDALVIARAGLGRDLGHGLYEAELRWLVEREWAVGAEDVLWRRSKLGLRFSAAETEALARHLDKLLADKTIKAA